MQELIDRLVKETGVTPEQAKQSIETIAAFVKEKFPMLGGAVNQIFKAGGKESATFIENMLKSKILPKEDFQASNRKQGN